MYTMEEIAPYLGLLYMMLEELGGEFTYSPVELEKVAFHNTNKAICQTTAPNGDVTIRLAERCDIYLDETNYTGEIQIER